jgi:hypothetical protein
VPEDLRPWNRSWTFYTRVREAMKERRELEEVRVRMIQAAMEAARGKK